MLQALLRGEGSGVYVQEKREVAHVQKEVAPAVPFWDCKESSRELNKWSVRIMLPDPCLPKKPQPRKGAEEAGTLLSSGLRARGRTVGRASLLRPYHEGAEGIQAEKGLTLGKRCSEMGRVPEL